MGQIKRSHPRNIKFTVGVNPYAAGSVMAEFGNTKVLITATIEPTIPPWLIGQGKGWITAEYSMLPGSTHTRSKRETKGLSGRTQEIQRLIGRSLRSVVNLKKLGERSIIVDCDVLVADGGTRTTSISGAFVALRFAIKTLLMSGKLVEDPITDGLAAISVGVDKTGSILADLNYEEDSSCEVDMNVVMTESGKFVEIQGTGEEKPFSADHLNDLLSCAKSALEKVFEEQNKVFG
jgi:ribonuclease PH